MRTGWSSLVLLLALRCDGGDYSLGSPDISRAGSAAGDGLGSAGSGAGPAGGSGLLSGGSGGSLIAVGGAASVGSGGFELAGAGTMGGGGDGAIENGGGGAYGDGGEPPFSADAGAGGADLDCPTAVETLCLPTGVVSALADAKGSGGLASAFPNPSVMLFSNSQLNAINANGQIAGARLCGPERTWEGIPVTHRRATMFENGVARDLIRNLGEEYSEAVDINDQGVVIGHFEQRHWDVPFDRFTRQRDLFYGFIWKDGKTTLLRELGRVKMIAINNAEEVLMMKTTFDDAHAVNCASQPCGTARALLWKDGKVTDLGSLGGASTQPLALNERGQVLGLSQRAGAELATDPYVVFSWEKGVMRELPLPLELLALNNAGHVAVGLNLWDGQELIERGPDEKILALDTLVSDGSAAGVYQSIYMDGFLLANRPFIYSAGNFVPLWGVQRGRQFSAGVVNDMNESRVMVGTGITQEEIVLEDNGNRDGLRDVATLPVVWSPDCYLGCCSATDGGATSFDSANAGGGGSGG